MSAVATFKIIGRTGKTKQLVDVPIGKAGTEAQAMRRAAVHYAKQLMGDSSVTAMVVSGAPPASTTFCPARGGHVFPRQAFRVRRG